MELWQGVCKLREVVSEELGEDWHVFPVFDDFHARQGGREIWPQARCLRDDGSVVDLSVVVGTARKGKSARRAKPAFPIPPPPPEPLTKLVDELFYSHKLNTVPVREEEEAHQVEWDLESLLAHLYHCEQQQPAATMQRPLTKQHAGFVNVFGLVPCRNGSKLLLYRGNDINFRSLVSFNRHALRRYKDHWSDNAYSAGAGGGLEVGANPISPTIGTSAFTNWSVSAAGFALPVSVPPPPPQSSSASSSMSAPVIAVEAPFLLGSDPIVEGECDDLSIRFLFYQAVRALQHLHLVGPHGSISPEALTVTGDLWLEMIPPTAAAASATSPTSRSSPFHVQNDTKRWRNGEMSNFDYLMNINHLSGRRSAGAGTFHAILPWVLDFAHEHGRARDLTRTKYRLKKGETQLLATYSSSLVQTTANMPHHIPESLSELTYYMYASRNTPLLTLQRIVRPSFEPKEYPSSLARLYEWTPDECIPEFFVDPKMFLPSRLGLKCLICGGNGSDGNHHLDEARAFLQMHLQALETCDKDGLAKWIDLHFGIGLQGRQAIDSLNVVLSRRPKQSPHEPFAVLNPTPDFVRVFDKPHPIQQVSPHCRPPPVTPCTSPPSTPSYRAKEEETFLSQVLSAMLAPRGGLKLLQSELKNSTFLGSDLVEWLLARNLAGVDSTGDAVALAQKMMASGYFIPEQPLLASSSNNSSGLDATGGGELDFVDADDCAYRFRLADKRWNLAQQQHGATTTATTSAAKPLDLGNEKPNVLAGFRAQQMCVDAEVSGLLRTCTYYGCPSPNDPWRDDLVALALVMGELYLGKPVEEAGDLDVLPLPVANALKHALEEDNTTDLRVDTWLDDLGLFPRHFAVAFDFISAIKLFNTHTDGTSTDGQCTLFVQTFFDTFAPLGGGGNKPLVEATWLTFSLAHGLVLANPSRFGDMFAAMHRVLGEEPSFRAFVDSLVGLVALEHWVNVLPVDVYLAHFVDVLVWCTAQDTSALLAAGVVERALLRAENQQRLMEMLSTKLPHNAPVFRVLSKYREELAPSRSVPPGLATYLEDFEGVNTSTNTITTTTTLVEEDSSDDEAQQAVASTNTAPKRNIQFRFLAHNDAPISCMTVSCNHMPSVSFCTGSKKGEVALWSYSPHLISQSCRFQAGEDAIKSLRLVDHHNLLVGTVRNNMVAMFDLQEDRAVRATAWIPNVRCAESFHRDSVLVLGETTGDVSLADFRTANAHLFARFALPVPPGNVVRSLYTHGEPSIICSVNERLFELDVRMVGRVCREWSAPAPVSKLFGMEHGRKLVTVMKAGNLASVWDISQREAKIRLRTIAGFADSPSTSSAPTSSSSSKALDSLDEMDSLSALSEDGAGGAFMYVVRGGHKISRVPLTLLEDPKEVRVTPLSLSHHHPILGSRRYKPGNLCLTSVCVLPGQVVLAAGHEHGTKPFAGAFVHMVV
ncbi:hypothetical protein BASA81_000569 [Batrachochytrium salamandrivorans]|nr:hypothetical protein BASA81_000569 [Batrachochytrium salamandrivorans]